MRCSDAYLDRFNVAGAQFCLAQGLYNSCVRSSCGAVTMCGPQPPPPPPIHNPNQATLTITPVESLDPNDKVGEHGIQQTRYVTGSGFLEYAIFFENKQTATAPAQKVIISDQLDATNLDLSSLTLGQISFGSFALTPPIGATNYVGTVDLRPGTNLLVSVAVRFDRATGFLTWTLSSTTPGTGQPPTDPLAGFLPPGIGGSVLYTIMPRSGTSTGTQIRNTASIVFDTNAPILTPEWLNTIDKTKPSSHVTALPPTQPSLTFPVQWTGTDVGSGVQDFTIYVSDNASPFTVWLTNTTVTQATYTGQVGHTYSFYSIARDLVGNVESAKTAAEATTTVNLGAPTIRCTGCYFTANGLRATFAFNIGSTGPTSTFTYNYRSATQTVQFASTSTTQISAPGNTATFSGQGTLNGQAGYSFTVIAKDGGAVGSGLDTVSISITGPNNYSYSVNGTVIGGDIVVKQ